MFFTTIGRVLAHLGFWLGTLRVGMGLFLAFGTPDMENNRAAAQRYLGTATSVEAINEGMVAILVSVALGVLCDISARKNNKA